MSYYYHNQHGCRHGCRCHKCQPTNPSNRTIITGVPGASAYEGWLSYNPDLDPNLNPESPWTEIYWLDNYVQQQLIYTEDEL